MANILVTGGAGFIGSHLVDALIEHGNRVTAFDNLDPAAHPQPPRLPAYANLKCRYMIGDVRDKDALREALQGIDVVFHDAAAVGVGNLHDRHPAVCRGQITRSLSEIDFRQRRINNLRARRSVNH